jgi:hypothetical protein
MSPIVLSEILGVDLQPCQEENPARCALSDQHGQYVLDDQQRIIGLNLFGYNGEDDRPALPSPADWLPELPLLKYLNLAQCGLTVLDLTAQTELVVLFAQENKALTELKLPAAFLALLRAVLDHCALTRVIWPESPVLEFLNVSRQEEKSLTDWSFAAACPRLYFCDLSHNGLTRFQLGDGFTNLGILCLEDNALTEVSFGGELPGLESLRLSENKLTTVKSEWLERAPNLLNLFLEKNEIEERYQTFIEDKSPHEAMLSLRDVFRNEALGTEKDDECKVMLIGNGNAGKSTIVRRLRDGKFHKDYVSTHGAKLFTYPRNDWKLNFWDFGGQDVYHATHRLFMQSNVVYLLVWNEQTDPKVKGYQDLEEDGELRHYRNYSIPYWLHYADALGKGSPILLVQTRKNDGIILDPPGLRLIGVEPAHVHQIESSEDDIEESGYDDMLRYITRSVKKIKAESGAMAASNILAMRSWMRERLAAGQKIMSQQEYLKEAGRLKISGAEDVLKSWLHRTGVLFYNPQQMGGRIILDQEWAIDAIYTLFDRGKPHFKRLKEAGGVFRGMELEAIWKNWPEADPELFVEFMLSCEVCFELPTGEQELAYRSFMVPGLLPEKPDSSFEEIWKGRPHWEVHFRYEILHYGVVQSFLVKTQQMANRGKMTQVSTILADEPQVATVEARREKEYLNRVVVKIGKSDYQLLGQIASVLADLQGTAPEVLLRDTGSGQLVTFKRIDAAFRSNDHTVETESNNKVSVAPYYDFWDHRAKGHLVTEEQSLEMLSDDAVMRHIRGFIQTEYAGESPNAMGMPSARPVVRQPQPKPEGRDPSRPIGPKTILFTSANPRGMPPLKIEKELVNMMTGLRGSSVFKLEFISRLTTSEFINEVCSLKPHILHFSGHGEDAFEDIENHGIVFSDLNGNPKLVSTEILEKVFTELKKWPGFSLEYVLLNSCHSKFQAEAISKVGFVAIGTSTIISDTAAIAFSEGFYRAIGRGEEVYNAVSQGRMDALLCGLGETRILIYHNGKIVSE